ncbi:hypothetical protein C8Q77DRAFT_1118546 [Trametes polyzona]|nr:hypothetical protein C8Q77DRAFT_1118546 [Trametes polyzona]
MRRVTVLVSLTLTALRVAAFPGSNLQEVLWVFVRSSVREARGRNAQEIVRLDTRPTPMSRSSDTDECRPAMAGFWERT